MSSTETPPDAAPAAMIAPRPDVAVPAVEGAADTTGAAPHWRALEGLYASAPINHLFRSSLQIVAPGRARITFDIDERAFHAAGAAHGTVYFKMLDDAAFYAANTLITDRFLLTSAFNLHLTKPLRAGPVVAEGQWVSGRRRVLVAESRLLDAQGDEVARGTGTFVRSRIALSGLEGYARAATERSRA